MIEKISIGTNTNNEIKNKLNIVESYFIYILLKEIDIFKNEKKSFPFKIFIDNMYIHLSDYITQKENIGISRYFSEFIQKEKNPDNIKKPKEEKNVGRIEKFI